EAALDKVRQDKLREVKAGHDGSWVAHPGLVPIAMEVFDANMPSAHQIDNPGNNRNVTAADLLQVPAGTITEQGVRENIRVGILYLESWLRGNGAAALFHKMEDAATAEISRTQLWQWIHQDGKLENGQSIDMDYFEQLLQDEIPKLHAYSPLENKLEEAVQLFAKLVRQPAYEEFLTIPAYGMI
ncbi:MAG: malate synthase A, partial [Bacteroidota bacterium]